jgi:death on curing protein
MRPDFLSVDDIYALHARQLGRFGGGSGVRDEGLLASALAQPQAAFGGEWMHPTLEAMAAAYLFHVASNHPFVDGNKRVGLLSALLFLHINGVVVDHSSDAFYALTMEVAAGQLSKEETTERLVGLVRRG